LQTTESRFVAVFAGVLVIFTSIPYIAGIQLPFPDSRFDQVLSFDSDFNSYFAFMRQARDGQWLFHSPYTSEAHAPALFNLEWLVFGKLARVLGGSLEAAMHVERVVGIFLLAFGLYRLCSLLLEGEWMRRFAFALVLLGGGFGWIRHVPVVRNWLPPFLSLDLYAGVHPFFWMLIAPHFLLPQALAVWTVVMLLTNRYVAAAVLLLATGAARPFDLLQLSAAIGLFGLLRRSLPALAVVAATLPLWLHYLWIFKFHPIFQWWSIQNVFPPRRPSAVAWGLGLGGLLFLWARFGLPHLRRPASQPTPRVLLVCCALCSLALLYSFPLLTFSLQIITTLAIPVVLIGVTRLRPHRGWLVLLVLNSLTSAVVWRASIYDLERGSHRTPHDLLAAYDWLARHTRPRDLVLASEQDSNRLPRYASVTVFWGYFTTVSYQNKKALMQEFFEPATTAEWRREFLAHHRFRYVLLRADRTVPAAPLQEVFRNGMAVIYQVLP
jgi:hypothetical protein